MERKKSSFCPIFLLIFHRCIREKWQKIGVTQGKVFVGKVNRKKKESTGILC